MGEVDEDAEAVHLDDEFHPELRESVAARRGGGAVLVELARVRPSRKSALIFLDVIGCMIMFCSAFNQPFTAAGHRKGGT